MNIILIILVVPLLNFFSISDESFLKCFSLLLVCNVHFPFSSPLLSFPLSSSIASSHDLSKGLPLSPSSRVAHMTARVFTRASRPGWPAPSPIRGQSKSAALSGKPRVFLELPQRSVKLYRPGDRRGRGVVFQRGWSPSILRGLYPRSTRSERIPIERPPYRSKGLRLWSSILSLLQPTPLSPLSSASILSLAPQMFRPSISVCLRVHATRYGYNGTYR